jgi:hypothetical protein
VTFKISASGAITDTHSYVPYCAGSLFDPRLKDVACK